MSIAQDCVRIASRAPSAHNTQPWDPRVDDSGTIIDLHLGAGRLLEAGDPTGRDALLSLGAWIEHVAIAAAARGHMVEIEERAGLAAFASAPTAVPSDAIVRLRLVPGAALAEWSDDDLQHRAVHRGRLAGDAAVIERTRAAIRPPFRLVDVDPTVFARLGAVAAIGVHAPAGVTAELLRWLRFTPRHPDWDRDGLSATTLLLPTSTARLAAWVTGTPGRARRTAALIHRLAPVLASMRRRTPASRGSGHPVAFVLAAADDVAEVAATARTPARRTIDAGRELCRIWLALADHGVSVAPRSEIVDDPRTASALRRHLRLAPGDVLLGAWDTGRASTPAPRSARLPV